MSTTTLDRPDVTSWSTAPDITTASTPDTAQTPAAQPGPRPLPPNIPPQMVVVDIETSGKDSRRHTIVEVAWWNLTTGERDAFVPFHDVTEMLREADLDALRINRYVERELGRRAATDDPDGARADRLFDQLASGHAPGRTTTIADRPRNLFCGQNPWFDAGFLAELYGQQPWNYRLRDVGNYASGVFGIQPDQPLGLGRICDMLGVEHGDHTAEGDVTATGRCLLQLAELARRVTWTPIQRATDAPVSP